MSRKRKTGFFVLAVLVAAGLVSALAAVRHVSRMEEIFAANETLKSEGYYLSEFEFEMLSAAYYLDRWQFLEALSRLDEIHGKLTTRQGLVKIPDFANADERLEFYLNLQNPETGAFYPNSVDPVFAYFGVTANMINFIETLSNNAGKPFRLKYPLRFLDEIDTPTKLTAMLDDVSQVGWIGEKFKAPFVSAIELRDLIEQDEHLGIYPFSDEWKHAFYQWFYDNQDETTGLWGARARASGDLLGGGDVGDSGKVIKMFVDNEGNDIHPDFPLRYVDQIVASSLEQLSKPMPDRLDEQHRWILDKDRGFRFLTRYIWKKASAEDRETVLGLIEEFIELRFERYFVRVDGAFSLYPDAGHADLDGTGEAVGMFDYIGALSVEKQTSLWGDPAETITDLGRHRISTLGRAEIDVISKQAGINSLRVYKADPTGGFMTTVEAIHYPGNAVALDLVDLIPRLTDWLEATPQNMGNWISRDSVLEKLSVVDADPAPVLGDNPLEEMDRILQDNSGLVVIGFDRLQVPRYRIVYEAAR